MPSADSAQDALGRAASLFRQRDLVGAEAACREALVATPGRPAALHLLALIRNGAGDAAEAERLMRASIAGAPAQVEFRNNLANLLRREGRLAESIAVYREALAANPQHRVAQIGLAHALNDAGEHTAAEARARELIAADARAPAAWMLLTAALREQQRWSEAEAAAAQALALAPAEPSAHHGLGALYVGMGRAEEAMQTLARAEELGLRGFDLELARGVALLQLYRVDEAEQSLAQAVRRQPRNADAQLRLANVRHMRGDADFARDLREAAQGGNGDPNLQMLLAKVLRRAGDLAGAESLLRDVIARVGPAPELRIALAETLLDQGRLKDAEREASEAAAARAHDARLLDVLVTILLRRGRVEDALPFIRAERARRPHSQVWIAHEAMAARLSGDSLHAHINDYARLLQSYDLESPPGWGSMPELNAAALAALDQRHRFAKPPLDHVVRNGSRTTRDLRREADPALRALLGAFKIALEEYARSVGTEASHPLSARNTGAVEIVNAWSTQLRNTGSCFNHIHEHGWISATYFVSAPPATSDSVLQSGWLRFGEARYAPPGADPEGVVEPKAGRLVLFPSYMWHGTNPLTGAAPRTSISFDALPRPR